MKHRPGPLAVALFAGALLGSVVVLDGVRLRAIQGKARTILPGMSAAQVEAILGLPYAKHESSLAIGGIHLRRLEDWHYQGSIFSFRDPLRELPYVLIDGPQPDDEDIIVSMGPDERVREVAVPD